MARIRSVHPGLFTDEDFVTLSDSAQIFYIGLLTVADDQGIFEWKPITLKMRLRPASTQPVDGLLSELLQAGKVANYEIGGRTFGAIRNFRKYQRPKSPNAIYPITDQWRKYVGIDESISEMEVDDETSFPPNGEIAPQMEEVGGRREGEEEKKRARNPKFEEWWLGYPEKVGKGAAEKAFEKASQIAGFDELVAGVQRYRSAKPPDRAWCNPATWLNQKRWLDQPAAPSPQSPHDWRDRPELKGVL